MSGLHLFFWAWDFFWAEFFWTRDSANVTVSSDQHHKHLENPALCFPALCFPALCFDILVRQQ